MTHLFISDLHLSADHPRLIRGFLQLLKAYQHQSTQLYILGDWFNIWVGDDDTSAWLSELVTALQDFVHHGNHVYFLAGNRDFAVHNVFLKQFNGTLLPDGYVIEIAHVRYRLEHGDALCTDDVSYQRFKKIIRNPLLLAILRRTPLGFRKKLAYGFRQKSHHVTQYKSDEIMDVNEHAVMQALQGIDVLIHGHTHRPQMHQYTQHKRRIVLGDWQEKTGQAMLFEISAQDEPRFFSYCFD